MKIKILSILCVALCLAGCREITITTKVNADGSCVRTVTMDSDSSDVFDTFFNIPRDSSWVTEYTENQTDSSENVTYIAKKTFRKVSDLNGEFYPQKSDSFQVRIFTKLEKRFRGYFTYLRYSEAYEHYFPFWKIPVSEYLTEEEIEIYKADPDSGDIDDKVEEWQTKSMLEEFWLVLADGAKKLNDPALSPEKLQAGKERLYEEIDESSMEDPDEMVDDVLRICEKVYGTSSVWRLRADLVPVIKRIDEYVQFIFDIGQNSYINKVTMPGLLMDTNAGRIEGNEVTWEFDSDRFSMFDHEMWVESRIVNQKFILISAIVLLLLITVLVISLVKGRGNRPSV